ncbi:MAG: DNA-directed RNA polymerase subunit omega [Bacteroidetes bacterium]|nr:DNA-directed RNA polymerase subunit omega [Bacteroidota bacterium]MBL7103637.1 DNA-directed RNA polymerase subunit omega [Bacteroidales bacterium]
MDYKKIKTDTVAITRRIRDFDEPTGNIYESVAIISKRANQISLEMKEELSKKIQEFSTSQDNLEEIFENREQIEITRYYERLPKAALIAIYEFLNDKVYYRNPQKKIMNPDIVT